jgi:hypothetical protein
MPVRASRAVVLRDGDVLLMADSGMTPGAPLESDVYNPATGTYTALKTPADFSRRRGPAPGREGAHPRRHQGLPGRVRQGVRTRLPDATGTAER